MENLVKNPQEALWVCQGCGKVMLAQAEYGNKPDPADPKKTVVTLKGYRPSPAIEVRLGVDSEKVAWVCSSECARNAYLILRLSVILPHR